MSASAIAFARNELPVGGVTAIVAAHVVPFVAERREGAVGRLLCHRHLRAAQRAVRRAGGGLRGLHCLQRGDARLEFGYPLWQADEAFPYRDLLQELGDV